MRFIDNMICPDVTVDALMAQSAPAFAVRIEARRGCRRTRLFAAATIAIPHLAS